MRAKRPAFSAPAFFITAQPHPAEPRKRQKNKGPPYFHSPAIIVAAQYASISAIAMLNGFLYLLKKTTPSFFRFCFAARSSLFFELSLYHAVEVAARGGDEIVPCGERVELLVLFVEIPEPFVLRTPQKHIAVVIVEPRHD